MTTASPTKKSPKKPSTASAPSKPFLRFYHSEALRRKTLSLLDKIEQAPDATVHRAALADLAVELTSAGLDYYIMQSLKAARPGFVVEQTANLGMAGVQQLIGSVTRQVVGRMESPQLISVCGSIRQFMI